VSALGSDTVSPGPTPQTEAVSDTALETSRTVDRRLVHRAALSEVFLTGFRSVDAQTFRGAAQVPPRHFYYGDHLSRPAVHDPLAVFESVRQMLLAATHLQHGAGTGTKAITAQATLDITRLAPLLHRGGPLDLDLRGYVVLEKTYQGAVSRVVHEVRVDTADGRTAGTVRVDTALRPDDVYGELRMSHRTGPPPHSGDLPVTAPGEPVGTYLVGRTDPGNVVLARRSDEGGNQPFSALLHVPVRHPSMFDHPQEHVPGPVLMEAARQAVLLLAGEQLGLSPDGLSLTYLHAEYLRFAELDSELVVGAQLVPVPADGRTAVCGQVVFEQSGAEAARMEVRLGSLVGLRRATAGTADDR
jgi:hypothetical protein